MNNNGGKIDISTRLSLTENAKIDVTSGNWTVDLPGIETFLLSISVYIYIAMLIHYRNDKSKKRIGYRIIRRTINKIL